MAVGTLLQASGQARAGRAAAEQGLAQQAGAEYEAAAMQVRAGQERASAQRAMIEERRKGRIIQSNLQARAAASGAGALDPTVADISGDLAAETEYRALTAMYQGEDAAQGLETSARLRRFEGGQYAKAGKVQQRSSNYAAFGTLLTGGGSLYDKYFAPAPISKAKDIAWWGPRVSGYG